MASDSMDLICYKYDGWQPRIRPGTPKRAWMDRTNERYAYRCLPLNIANSHGWELLSPVAFEAKWDGGDQLESVVIRMDDGYAPHLSPVSIFGYGTMTFHVEAIFRTPPGWNLHVTGPPNRQKDGIQALAGIIETDWSPYTFTMNWRFTRANEWIRFEESEPIAFFFPVERGAVERFAPRIERLEDQPDLKAAFEKWSESRTAFQKWVLTAHTAAPSDKWQKLYFRGLDPDGKPAAPDHQAKLRAQPFVFPDGTVMDPPEEKVCPVHRRPAPAPVVARSEGPANILLNPAAGTAGAAGAINPGLSLALDRIGLKLQPETQAAILQQPVRPDRSGELALKRRDWILDAQAKQRLVSPRNKQIERVSGLSGEDFRDLFYALSRPVVLAGALRDWPAVKKWMPDYLAKAVGAAEVEVQAGRNANPDFELYKEKHRRQMPFDRFIAEIVEGGFGNDLYMTAFNSPSNRAALAPLDADLGELSDYLKPGAGMMWLGPAGTFTPLHFDLTNNLIAQVVGAKHLTLLPPSETQRLYNHKHVFSAVHDITDEGQLSLYPRARAAHTFEVDLEPGDALFVPFGWWHQVTALDFSVTLTYTDFHWANDAHKAYPRD
jgi:mannose-6-phosphate isomerase-like protein (cupin superfamily)